MDVVDHNKDQLLNLHFIMNVNSIVMIKLIERFLPIMCMIGKMNMVKVAFVV